MVDDLMTDSLEFWNIVGEPGDPTTLDIGDAVNIEYGNLRMVKIICDKWTNDDGLPQIKIRDPQPEDSYDPPTMTVIVPQEIRE